MIMLKVQAVPFQWQRNSLGEAWTGSRGLAHAQSLHCFSGGVLRKGLGFPHILLSFGLLDFQFFMVITYIHKALTSDAQIMYKD